MTEDMFTLDAPPSNERTTPVYELVLREVRRVTYTVDKVVGSWAAIALAREFLRPYPTERLLVIYLDNAQNVVGCEVISQGGIAGCATSPREIFQGALRANASSIVLAHNHPSGDPTPSQDDIEMTVRVVAAGNMIGIPLLDHVIVTRNGDSSSMQEIAGQDLAGRDLFG